MNSIKYRWILYFISFVILATLCIQGYWNYKNYLVGKQQLINDVQTSLDNAVDNYYTGLAQQRTFQFFDDSLTTNDFFADVQIRGIPDTMHRKLHDSTIIGNASFITRTNNDSIKIVIDDSVPRIVKDRWEERILGHELPFEMLTSKIVVSISEDSLSLSKMDSLVAEELRRKNISIEYGLAHSNILHQKDSLRVDLIKSSKLKTTSHSPYFYNTSSLTIHFSNITYSILKKNMLGILLSFLLSLSVIFCLLYLLKIIKQQKHLAEIKNDFISNITHEFKTPIATIGLAMEGIQSFNNDNDTEKSLRYAKISQEQVSKLNEMVEKLLETATLDSDNISTKLERTDLVELLRQVTTREMFLVSKKNITFNSSEEILDHDIDVFHFENAINNIVDNAIKYGGDEIEVSLKKNKKRITIVISDSGNSLSDSHRKQIFEKFYRVPKGNTHDQKGFGIGLYYTKKIVEKHGGQISLETNGNTKFVIELPHE